MKPVFPFLVGLTLLNAVLATVAAFLRADINALRVATHQRPFGGILSPWASIVFALYWVGMAITWLVCYSLRDDSTSAADSRAPQPEVENATLHNVKEIARKHGWDGQGFLSAWLDRNLIQPESGKS